MNQTDKNEQNLTFDTDVRHIGQQMFRNVDPAVLELLRTTAYEYAKIMAYYRSVIMEIETKFNVLNEEFLLEYDRNPIVSLSSRIKRFPSIQEKLQRCGYPLSLSSMEENLHDVAGIRVICSFIQDVYMLEKAFLSQDDVRLIQRKDYIAHPKANGYRSLHLIVEIPIFLTHEKRTMKAEIQLRTMAMDCWATLEHQICYKKDRCCETELQELCACAQLSAQLDERMESLWEMRRNQSTYLEDPKKRLL